MISSSSTLASSHPATSWNVTFGVSPVSSFALDFPKAKARFPPCCTCRKKNTQSPMRMNHGSRLIRSVPKPVFGSFAEIGTFRSSKRWRKSSES